MNVLKKTTFLALCAALVHGAAVQEEGSQLTSSLGTSGDNFAEKTDKDGSNRKERQMIFTNAFGNGIGSSGTLVDSQLPSALGSYSAHIVNKPGLGQIIVLSPSNPGLQPIILQNPLENLNSDSGAFLTTRLGIFANKKPHRENGCNHHGENAHNNHHANDYNPLNNNNHFFSYNNGHDGLVSNNHDQTLLLGSNNHNFNNGLSHAYPGQSSFYNQHYNHEANNFYGTQSHKPEHSAHRPLKTGIHKPGKPGLSQSAHYMSVKYRDYVDDANENYNN